MDGQIPVRVRMPAERHLAEMLKVSRTTVTSAYDLLRERGYLESRQGSGSWTALPDPATTADNPWLSTDGDGLVQLHCAAPPAPSALRSAMLEAVEDGDMVVLQAGKTMKVLAEMNMGSATYATPVPANGVLFINNRNELYALMVK